MKKNAIIVASILAMLATAVPAAVGTVASSSAKPGRTLRVGTFNIRCATGKDRGQRSWNARKGEVLNLIRRMKCDVIGLQEVTPGQYRDLRAALGGEYGFVGAFRNRDRKSGEAVPVCFLKSRFELVKSGTFWLSAHPDSPGSRDWGAKFPRTCSWTLLKDRVTRKSLCFANTHPDHASAKARVNGAKVIANRLAAASGGAPVVLVGDHNCEDNEPPAVFLRSVYSDSIYVTKKPPKGPWRSFTGWRKVAREFSAVAALRLKPDDRAHGRAHRIDYIYVTPKKIDVLGYATIGFERKGAGEYYSDHFPVLANILIR